MAFRDNPFTPNFGEVPPHMAGRSTLIQEFTRTFKSPSRRPALTTLISGARGTGKTALLSLISEEAEANGWIVANVSAFSGMLQDIIERLEESADHLLQSNNSAHVTGLGVGQIFNVEFQRESMSQGADSGGECTYATFFTYSS